MFQFHYDGGSAFFWMICKCAMLYITIMLCHKSKKKLKKKKEHETEKNENYSNCNTSNYQKKKEQLIIKQSRIVSINSFLYFVLTERLLLTWYKYGIQFPKSVSSFQYLLFSFLVNVDFKF